MKHLRTLVFGVLLSMLVFLGASSAPAQAPSLPKTLNYTVFYDLKNKETLAVATYSLASIDAYRLELDGVMGFSTKTQAAVAGFALVRRFTLPKTALVFTPGLVGLTSAGKIISGGFLLGISGHF